MKTPSDPQGQAGRAALLCVAAFAAFAVIAYGSRLHDLASALLHGAPSATNHDFANYWVAGRLALSGDQQILFDFKDYNVVLQAIFGSAYPMHNWSYPPHFLLLLWPLGLLGYDVALVTFLLATLALFVFAAVTFRQVYAPGSDRLMLAVAMTGYVFMMLDTTQNGFLTGACALLGCAWMKQRPVLAGLAFALLTIKPQLGVLIPMLLVFERSWRTVAWAAIFTALLIGLSLGIFGRASWEAYLLDTLPFQGSILSIWEGGFLMMMPTVVASLRTLSITPKAAFLVQWPASAAVTALTVWLLYKENDTLRRICIVLCATFLISPYAFNYDMGALSVAIAVLIGSQVRTGASPGVLLVLGVVAALPAGVMFLGIARLPIAPLVLAAGLAAITARSFGPNKPLPEPART